MPATLSVRRVECKRQRAARTRVAALIVAGLAAISAAQEPAAPSAPSSAPRGSLVDRQVAVREELGRFETRVLKLYQTLLESEPGQAHRLQDALDQLGELGVRARIDQIVDALQTSRLGDAEQMQQALLDDLTRVMDTLTNADSELDRLRSERERMEQLKRGIRTLMDEQAQALYRTQHLAEDSAQRQTTEGAPPAANDPQAALRALEQMQRELQQRAAGLERDLKPAEQGGRNPGGEAMRRAAEDMQSAGDRLGEQSAPEAVPEQKEALEQLQQALNELDDALRQVRREEQEQTLAAIEARLESLLTRERAIREGVQSLRARAPSQWERAEQLRLGELSGQQRAVQEDCQRLVTILSDEGTTVIVPELLRQAAADLAQVASRLEAADVGDATLATIDGVIALLEEILAATQQQNDARDGQRPPSSNQPQSRQGDALLPGSTELKLLRSQQLRVNERSRALVAAAGENERNVQELRTLADRQRVLVEMARRMHERP